MIPLYAFVLLALAILTIVTFTVWMTKRVKFRLIHKIYFTLSGLAVVWMLAVMALYFVTPDNETALYIIDSITNFGVLLPVLVLLISLAFVYGWNTLPLWSYSLFVIPVITIVMVWTNPLHHFYYIQFSVNSENVVFGWYFYIHSAFSYICVFVSALLMILFAFTNRSRLYMQQALFFAAGNSVPLLVNLLAVANIIKVTILVPPMSYVFGTVLLHGFAIFRFHMLDIKPMAMQTVLNWISDCYLVLSSDQLVINYNNAFKENFGSAYGIKENTYLYECASGRAAEESLGIHTLIASVESCRTSGTTISYEQSLFFMTDGVPVRRYYMIDITPLFTDGEIVGFVIFFKDVTKLKDSMQRLHNSTARLMEQERLAFLGQMMGGISHNLKTPIMSISGSASSINLLVDEAEKSLGDPEVTEADYREIIAETKEWTSRIQEACAYMSDIITAVKGQAANLSTTDAADFSMDDVMKRCILLLRHELVGNKCTVEVKNTAPEALLHGDINSMVQVINNLIGNSIDAMKPHGGVINVEIFTDANGMTILVRDHGPGVSDDVKKTLFKQMVTSKGALGTGLGIYMSNSFIKAQFGGKMWCEDNPGGGAVFGILIPNEYIAGHMWGDGDNEKE